MIEFINAHHGKTLCQTFTDLAARTWEYLDLGSKFGLLPGEETLTDENLMAIYALHYSYVAIKKFSRYRESELGADWEWWFGNQTDGWFGMRVQAKKIDIQTYSLYPELKRPHNEERQISDLISGCTNTQIFPAYCFYNTRIESKNPEWGCSITPAQAVMNIFDQDTSLPSMRFKKIEENSFPWHKLVCHPNLDEPNSRNFPNAVRDAIISNTGPTIQNSIPGIVNNLPDYAQLLIRQIKEATGLFQMRYIVEDESLERIIPPVKYLMIISDQIFPRLSANQMLSWKN